MASIVDDLVGRWERDNGQATGNERPGRPWRSRRVAALQRIEEDKENSPPVEEVIKEEIFISGGRAPFCDITERVNDMNFNQATQSGTQTQGQEPNVDDDGFTTVLARNQKRAQKPKRAATAPTNNSRAGEQPSEAPTTATRRHGPPPSGPRTSEHGVLFSEQQAGMICQHRDMRPSTDPKAKTGDPDIEIGPDGELWFVKARNFATIARHGESVTEAAIYMCNDNGLANKPAEFKGEYLSLRPSWITDKDFVNHSPGNPVLEIGTEFVQGLLTRRTMVVKFTELQTRPVNRKELLKVAELKAESIDILKAYAVKALAG